MAAANNTLLDNVTEALRYITSGVHAVPADNPNPPKGLALVLADNPATHRLWNVIGMLGGFSAGKYLIDIAYGHKINGSQYEEIKAEDVPKPLRWLHKIIDNNPFSNAPEEEWKKILHQMVPAAAGAAGAIWGSGQFFKQNGTEKEIQDLIKKDTLTPLEADKVAAYKQGETWRVFAGLSAWLSSASGLTGLLYGGALNPSFLLCNISKTLAGASEISGLEFLRNFSNTQSTMGLGPAKALNTILTQTQKLCTAKPDEIEKAADIFGKKVLLAVYKPFFAKMPAEAEKKIAAEIKDIFSQAYRPGKSPDALKQEITQNINNLLQENNLGDIGSRMLPGNNGWLGQIAEFFDFGRKIEAIREKVPGYEALQKEAANHALAMAAAIGGAGVLGWTASGGGGNSASASVEKDLYTAKAHDYVEALEKEKAKEKPKGFINGTLLNTAKWFGDAALAVAPMHRVFASIGLTTGGGVGLWMAKLLTGRSLSSDNPVAAEKFPEVVRGLHGVLGYDPTATDNGNKLKKIAGLLVFAASCATGVIIGSKHAYAKTDAKNETMRESIADFMVLTRQEHGAKMVPLVAASSVFGSAAGTFLAPPVLLGVNYGGSLAARTVSEQDRNMMAPVLGPFQTGNKTNSYLGVREGMDYIAKYAVYNPEKNPEQLESLSLTVLSQVADTCNTPLTGAHIKCFVDKLHSVREKYWEEGGVPKEKQAEMLLEMKQHFSGKGLDRTLYESGLDALNADFRKIGGSIGWVARLMGANKKIDALQKEYRETILASRAEWMDTPLREEAQETTPVLLENNIASLQRKSLKPVEKLSSPFPAPSLANNIVNIERKSLKPAANPPGSFQERREADVKQLAGIGLAG